MALTVEERSLAESTELHSAISELAMAMGNPCVRADLLKHQTIESQTIRFAAERLKSGSDR